MIGTIRKDVHWTPTMCPPILVPLIPWPLQGANHIDEVWLKDVEAVLSPLWHLDIIGPGLKWNCADGFQRHYHPLLAAWVGEYLEQVMVAHVSYASFPMCEIPHGVPIGHSTRRPLQYSRTSIFTQSYWRTPISMLCTL
jgi:hypothetical protein